MYIYINDNLVTGPTTEEHLLSLKVVMMRLEEANAKHQRNKCFIMLPSMETWDS